MIYTSDGYTESPEGHATHNCQILARLEAESKEAAVKKFLKNTLDFDLYGFNKENILVAQLDNSEWV